MGLQTANHAYTALFFAKNSPIAESTTKLSDCYETSLKTK